MHMNVYVNRSWLEKIPTKERPKLRRVYDQSGLWWRHTHCPCCKYFELEENDSCVARAEGVTCVDRLELVDDESIREYMIVWNNHNPIRED